jgi:type I restriction enzyme S subunit
MKSLHMARLGDLVYNLDNRRIPLNGPERDAKRGSGKYPYFGANNALDRIDEYLFDEKILCVAEDGGAWGRGEKCSYIVNEKCWVNNHAHVLTAKPNVHLEFLRYFLNYSDLNSYITGTTRGKLTKSALERIVVPLPPLNEQKRIAAILDKADAIREKRRQAIAKLDTLLQSVFLDMFGDPVTNPKGWERLGLANVCSQITDGVHATPKYQDSGVPFISTVHISEEGINWGAAKYITEQEHEALVKRCRPELGDILYTKVGSVGFALPITEDHEFSIFVQLALLKVVPEKSNFRFICQMLNMPSFRHQVVARLAGATMKYIGIGDIGKLSIISPPLTLQNQFSEFVSRFDMLRMKQKTAAKDCESLFHSLQHRAFNGEL